MSVIIPHQAGTGILLRCLDSLLAVPGCVSFEVLIVDNGSSDGSVAAALARHPAVRVLRLPRNQGFAGGCNRGIEATAGEYVVLLNDDTELAPGWLGALVAAVDSDPGLAACQPKIRSVSQRDHFEYSGAAGGLMDLYGYPFSRGRLMDHVEADTGQYDDPIEIFWASGVCLLLRRSALREAGGFDELFFAYMEEIDLCWRLQLLGWRVGYVPQAVVHHVGGHSLDKRVLRRMFLNHRNSVAMLIRNYSARWLCRVLPIRIALELAILLAALFRNPTRSRAVAMALPSVLWHLPELLRSRREIQRRRRVGDAAIATRLYLGMAPIWYFGFGVRRACDLPDIDRVLHRPLWPARLQPGQRLRLEARDLRGAYLDQAPVAVALVRAAEAAALAGQDFVRPILDARCGDGTFARVLFAGWPLERAVAADARGLRRARATTRYLQVDLAASGASLPAAPGGAATALVSAAGGASPMLAGELFCALGPGGRALVVAAEPEVLERFPLPRTLARLGLRRAARAWRSVLAWQLGVGPGGEAWRASLSAAGFQLEEAGCVLLPVGSLRLELWAVLALIGEPLRRRLGRPLLLPRLHRLLVRGLRLGRGDAGAEAPRWARLWIARRVG